MIQWQVLPEERSELFTPIGLRLLDDFSGKGPLGGVQAILDAEESPGVWRETDVQAVTSDSGFLIYPGLERRSEVVGVPARRYRVRLDCRFYRGHYQANADGIEFDAHPYNDSHPPAVTAGGPQDTFLLPAATYPFPNHVRVLHGTVTDNLGVPVADVLVTEGVRERVLSDERGSFSLPLRWVAQSTTITIDALDQRTAKTGSVNVTLPGGLATSHTIVIS